MRASELPERIKLLRRQRIYVALPDLKGPGGNAYALLGVCFNALRRAGIPEPAIKGWHTWATRESYGTLLRSIKMTFRLSGRDHLQMNELLRAL